MKKSIDWAQQVSSYSKDQLANLRANALKKNELEIVAICDAEVARRKPKKSKTNSPSKSHAGEIVLEFHFVCRREQNVQAAPNGRVLTGTWWVNKSVAEESARFKSYVALHEARADSSYLQGKIIEVRVSPRNKEYVEGRPVKNETGIDFLLDPTSSPLDWKGDATGEKGYLWGPHPDLAGKQ